MTNTIKPEWEYVRDDAGSINPAVRRLAVPGGWLYQVALFLHQEVNRVGEDTVDTHGWTAPVFVPRETVTTIGTFAGRQGGGVGGGRG